VRSYTVAWIDAPQWLTIGEVCQLSEYDWGTMLYVIGIGGVDVELNRGTWLIEKESLYDFQESLTLVLL
jgi:hypothetical protein